MNLAQAYVIMRFTGLSETFSRFKNV
uniref:Uncharacterized protein n=1 Tax=Anguilla anguilla TaxID=7936 RepID=A0A0E9U4J9_ANGAN